MKIKTSGYSVSNNLTVDTGINSCGKIEDGVVFRHDNRGGWLISFKDLKRIYLAAERARKVKS